MVGKVGGTTEESIPNEGSRLCEASQAYMADDQESLFHPLTVLPSPNAQCRGFPVDQRPDQESGVTRIRSGMRIELSTSQKYSTSLEARLCFRIDSEAKKRANRGNHRKMDLRYGPAPD